MNIVLLFLLTNVIVLYTIYKINKKEKLKYLYCNDNEWQPISTIPKNETNILISDGYIVKYIYTVRPNYKGNILICGIDNYIATHWRYLPKPPIPEEKNGLD